MWRSITIDGVTPAELLKVAVLTIQEITWLALLDSRDSVNYGRSLGGPERFVCEHVYNP
ncbi:hypothetical protein OMCYN_01615 [cyanobiont of Ornithocercus magnificus]|nr:hypothetical protein OMCYN_01615 [cyanobiont of Ornithocercus magnificus]